METNKTLEQPPTPGAGEKKRPKLGEVLCTLGFIRVALSFLNSLVLLVLQDLPEIPETPEIPEIVGHFIGMPGWYFFFSMVMSILFLIGLIYVWKMKRIGVIVLTCLFIVSSAVNFFIASPLFFGELLFAFIFWLVWFVLLWTQYKKMS